MTTTLRRIMFSVGEPSGDEHAAEVIKKLAKSKNFECYGMGGQKMQSAGAELIVNSQDIAVMGIVNIIRYYPKIRTAFKKMEKLLTNKRPDLLVIVDYPEFNLRLAKIAHKLGIKVLIYIAPQVWAWRKGRTKQIAQIADRIATILPFEKAHYAPYPVEVDYVGHPLIEDIAKCPLTPKPIDSSAEQFKVLIMPGSRHSEIKYLMPVLHQSMKLITQKSPKQISFHIIKADGVLHEWLTPDLEQANYDYTISNSNQYTNNDKFNMMASFDIAISASGTAILQLALCQTPSIAIYKLSSLTYLIAKQISDINLYTLPNILYGKQVIPELIQHNATAENITHQALDLLNHPDKRQIMREHLKKIIKQLETSGSNTSDNVVQIITEMTT